VPIVLASASSARRLLLERAGIAHVCEPAAIDEAAVKAAMQGVAVEEVALALADSKACAVATRRPGAVVIGADQILECDGRWFDKPADVAEAARHLRALRGRTHRLVSAAVAVRDGARLWRHVAEARLTMRPFSDHFLDDYLACGGPAILESVGAYRLEGPGAQLFETIDGDYFTILGLPLLPLLEFLRRERLLAE
jgi:septum formation protein